MKRIAVALVVLAGCRGDDRLPAPVAAAGSAAPRHGGTLRVSVVSDVRTLDAAQMSDEMSVIPGHLLYDTLIDYAPADATDPLALVPAAAESWGVSPDGLGYDFTLRPGLSYADGTPIVAQDFADQLEWLVDPKAASPFGQFLGSLESARAVDERHLHVTLRQPDALFLMLLATPYAAPVPRARRGQVLASGPFELEEHRPGDRVVLAKNPRYWDAEHVYLERIVMWLNVPRDVAVLKFLAGELDTVDRLSSDDYLRFLRAPAWRGHIVRMPPSNVFGEAMDVTKKPFSDVRVRRAMNYAVRKEDTVLLYNGRAVLSHGGIPPLLPGFDADLRPYPHDPERARALLAEAGYPDGLDVTYTIYQEEYMQRIAQSLQSDLAEVGVRVHLSILSFAAYVSAAQRRAVSFTPSAWTMDFPDAWDFLFANFSSAGIAEQGATNVSGYSNPELDRIIDDARRELDPVKRAASYRRADRIIHDDCPWIFHYHLSEAEVVQPYVRGYQPHPVWLRSFRRAWLDR